VVSVGIGVAANALVLGAVFGVRRAADVATPAPGPPPIVVARSEVPAAPAPKADVTLAPVQPAVPPLPTPPAVEARPGASAPAIAPSTALAPPLSRRERRRARALRDPVAAEEEVAAGKAPAWSGVPSLRIELLVWAADPAKRMVYLSGRKFVEGEAIENGAVIEQIVEDGVVLLYQGQRIRLHAEAR
jgi:hypothetical protein